VVGGFVAGFVEGVRWAAAVAFGALISATDPVAVIAFFRSIGVSKRLTILVEGESLFNDGVAFVIFIIALAAAGSDATFSVGSAVGQFFVDAFGGLGIGLVLGYVVSSLILKNLDDHLIETVVSVALAFGSYLLAEEFGAIFDLEHVHLSGILAVVAAGLMVGNIGLRNTSPTTRLTLENFWEFAAFVVNSLVFLLLGLQIHISELWDKAGAVLVALAAIQVTRLVVVYGLGTIHGLVQPDRKVPRRYQHVMFWGGLRGAISVALALSLAGEVDRLGRDLVSTLQVMTFGVGSVHPACPRSHYRASHQAARAGGPAGRASRAAAPASKDLRPEGRIGRAGSAARPGCPLPGPIRSDGRVVQGRAG
jgi:CPA1 family monovalent cation:H+ antiporter